MIGWLQCATGVSGDMLLGALTDAGVPLDVMSQAIDAVAPEGVTLRSETVIKAGIAATKVHVEATESHTHRTWRDIRAMLQEASFGGRDRALGVFQRLATAEAAVHGTTPEDIHFHEVGALDAIADVVGACAGLDHLGLDELVVSPIALGGGTVRAAHGVLAVPGPAVLRLLQGVPSYGGPVPVELATPTGAALVTEWATSWGDQPPMILRRQAFGAGTRDLPDRANVLRLAVGEAATATSREPAAEAAGEPAETSAEPAETAAGVILETNVDDLDGRIWPEVLRALLAAGAEDAWLVPILMKKGRSAHTLRVLTNPGHTPQLRRVIFTHTSAIGLREQPIRKHALDRSFTTVQVDGYPVRVKEAYQEQHLLNAQAEWEDVLTTADRLDLPPKVVLARAMAAFWIDDQR